VDSDRDHISCFAVTFGRGTLPPLAAALKYYCLKNHVSWAKYTVVDLGALWYTAVPVVVRGSRFGQHMQVGRQLARLCQSHR
jgi:hypothetical protein